MRDAPVERRHLLVVASQAKGVHRLEGLEEQAGRLHRLLTDPDVGGCEARSGASLLVGEALGEAAVKAAVVAAARAAEAEDAVLVLVFLGHGEAAPGEETGYTATAALGSRALERVQLPALLEAAANHRGLRGLIAVLDICHAAAGTPDFRALVNGELRGDLQFGLICASAAGEPAWDLALTRALIEVMSAGLGAGPTIAFDDHLRRALSKRVRGQLPAFSSYAGGAQEPRLMWLARNRRFAGASWQESYGVFGRAAISRACQDLAGAPDPAGLTGTELRALAAGSVEGESAVEAAARVHLRDVLRALQDARPVVELLQAELGAALTQELALRAAVLAGLTGEALWSGPPPLTADLVEHAALSAEVNGRPKGLALLLAALAHCAGLARLPAPWLAWLERRQVSDVAASRLAQLGATGSAAGVGSGSASGWDSGAGEQARLVLGLISDGTERVVRVDAWLLSGRAELDRISRTLPARESSLTGVLGEVVAWARDRTLRLGQSLERVDVAAPAFLLVEGRLEELQHTVGHRPKRLGAQFDIAPRWSGLLDPPPGGPGLSALMDAGHRLLKPAEGSERIGPHWLADEQLATVDALEDALEWRPSGEAALGVSRLPVADWLLIAEILLEHTPALVWPHSNEVCDGEELRAAVVEHWSTLPAQVRRVYREWRSTGIVGGSGAPLRNVRIAWHDEEWQAFCTERAPRCVIAPQDVSTPRDVSAPKDRTASQERTSQEL